MFNGYLDVALADEDLTSWRERGWAMAGAVSRPLGILGIVFGVPFLIRRRLAGWLDQRPRV
jgi:hypothetical protein